MPLLVYYMWILLGILVPLSLLFASDHVRFYLSMLFIIFIVIYSSFRVSRVVTNKRKRIATLTFWVFVYIFLGIVPLLQVTNQAFSWWSRYYDDIIITRAAIIALLGIFAFDIGYYAFSSKKNRESRAKYFATCYQQKIGNFRWDSSFDFISNFLVLSRGNNLSFRFSDSAQSPCANMT